MYVAKLLIPNTNKARKKPGRNTCTKILASGNLNGFPIIITNPMGSVIIGFRFETLFYFKLETTKSVIDILVASIFENLVSCGYFQSSHQTQTTPFTTPRYNPGSVGRVIP